MPNKPGIVPVITTLAEYQTRFWVEVGRTLRARGQDPLFLSFDSRSNEMLAAAGLGFVDATASAARGLVGDLDPRDVCARFAVDPLNFWLTHEKYAFGVTDSAVLTRKLAGTLLAAETALDQAATRGRPAMVQELGGFLSVIGSYFAARSRGLASWFIEPSFFRGRLLFLEGSVAARQFADDLTAPVGGDLAAYLADTLERSAIVIPQKDRHQYTTAFRKVINTANARRLVEKAADKYLFRKDQEFGHIGSHVRQHMAMIANSRRLRSHYTAMEELGPFIYYPLHVPGDMALTLRSPEYLDQLALIDYLCRVVPFGYRVAIKEHPAMIGAVSAPRLIDLARRHDNLAILPPSTNNFAVLRKSRAVVTVNSKSGAEAGLVGLPVIVLGDAFYRNAPFATAIAALSELGPAVSSVLEDGGGRPDPERTQAWFAGLWPETLPGELYVCDADNVARFSDSLEQALA